MAIVVLGICGCGSAPYMDLRHPIYLVPDKSLWSGCDQNPEGNTACRATRFQRVKEGVNQWFDYFDEDNRPRVVIISSKKGLPAKRVNEIIYLKIKTGRCGKEKSGRNFAACYNWAPFSSPEIVFDRPDLVTPHLMAHEFGHALGRRGHNDVPEGEYSVMSYKLPTNVLLRDIKIMCRLHHECRMEKRKQHRRNP